MLSALFHNTIFNKTFFVSKPSKTLFLTSNALKAKLTFNKNVRFINSTSNNIQRQHKLRKNFIFRHLNPSLNKSYTSYGNSIIPFPQKLLDTNWRLNNLLNEQKNLLSKVFSKDVPKGFGKFYPENNGKSEEGNGKDKEDPSKNEESESKENKPKVEGKNDKDFDFKSITDLLNRLGKLENAKRALNSNFNMNEKNDPTDKNKKADSKKTTKLDEVYRIRGLLITLTLLFIWVMLIPKNLDRTSEVSYQEFVREYLSKGVVDHIDIINYNRAYAYINDDLPDKIPKVRSNIIDGDLQYSSSDHDQYIYQGQHSHESSLYQQPNQNISTRKIVQFDIGSVDSFERNIDMAQRELGIDSSNFIPIKYKEKADISDLISNLPQILISAVTLYLFYYMSTRVMGSSGMTGKKGKGGMGNIFSIGKANPTIINKGEKVKTTFKDVAGLDNAKKEVTEFIEFLKDKEKFTKLGAKIPKGALLVGPPGTGKTLLAKAVAGESNTPFFSISGSDFLEMFVGVGPSRVRDLFEQARSNSPCIIFIDEIDAVGRARGKGGYSGGNDERENTLNQLLVEMDGFSSSTGIVVLAGTNRADILDKALMRPGRFDRQITIDLPDISERQDIFMVHLRPLTLSFPSNEIAARMAALSPGFSGADIANVCNEAAILAARKNKKAVGLKDFEEAQDRVIGGLQKSRKPMTEQEKKLIAYHEAGHAVTGQFTKYADPLLKVTVIPRTGGVLGFAQYLPRELQLYTIEQLIDRMCMMLGGRVSELIFFGQISTGAADDLMKVTELAYNQVKVYGMSEKVGHVSFPPKQEYELGNSSPYSEHLAKLIDEEARELIKTAYNRTYKLLEQKKNSIVLVAERLLKCETITHDDIVDLLGPRPYQNDQYKEYLKKSKVLEKKYGSDDVEELEKRALSVNDEALKLVREGDELVGKSVAEALEKYDSAIRMKGDNYLMFYKRALAHIKKNQLKLAVQDLSQSIDLNPDHIDSYISRASLLFDNRLNDYAKELLIFESSENTEQLSDKSIKRALAKQINADLDRVLTIEPDHQKAKELKEKIEAFVLAQKFLGEELKKSEEKSGESISKT